jgi:hypothetical protein
MVDEFIITRMLFLSIEIRLACLLPERFGTNWKRHVQGFRHGFALYVSSIRLSGWLTSVGFETSSALSFDFDLFGLGAVVLVVFLEPVVLQGLMCRDTLLGIVDEYLLEKIEELAVEFGVGWDDFLKSV